MRIVSAEQFVDGLFAALRLMDKVEMNLDDPLTDQQFALAYDDLLANAEQYGIVPDFVISADETYGDSTALRDAILAVRDLRTIALRNPSFVVLEISLDKARAEEVVERSVIPREVLNKLSKTYLAGVSR